VVNLWTRDTALLLALTGTAAVWLVLQFAVWLRAWRDPKVPRVLRWLSWLPPLTPVAGFMAGAWFLAVLWCIVAALYAVLRSQA
jgi:hypothetical protein